MTHNLIECLKKIEFYTFQKLTQQKLASLINSINRCKGVRAMIRSLVLTPTQTCDGRRGCRNRLTFQHFYLSSALLVLDLIKPLDQTLLRWTLNHQTTNLADTFFRFPRELEPFVANATTLPLSHAHTGRRTEKKCRTLFCGARYRRTGKQPITNRALIVAYHGPLAHSRCGGCYHRHSPLFPDPRKFLAKKIHSKHSLPNWSRRQPHTNTRDSENPPHGCCRDSWNTQTLPQSLSHSRPHSKIPRVCTR